jgi:hypothetical protein
MSVDIEVEEYKRRCLRLLNSSDMDADWLDLYKDEYKAGDWAEDERKLLCKLHGMFLFADQVDD